MLKFVAVIASVAVVGGVAMGAMAHDPFGGLVALDEETMDGSRAGNGVVFNELPVAGSLFVNNARPQNSMGTSPNGPLGSDVAEVQFVNGTTSTLRQINVSVRRAE